MLRPPVGGTRRGAYLPLALLVAGTATGGAALGLLVGAAWLLVDLVSGLRQGLAFGMVALAAIAVALPSVRRWVPERSCQVASARMLTGSLGQAALRWGVTLGLGLCTFIVTPAIYALIGVGLSLNDALTALPVFVSYGVVRGMTIACFALAERAQEMPRIDGTIPELNRTLRIPLLMTICLVVAFMLGGGVRG